MQKRHSVQSKMHRLCAKRDFPPSIVTCSEHKHGVFSDMKLKIKILTNFNFIILSLFMCMQKLLHNISFWAYITLHCSY